METLPPAVDGVKELLEESNLKPVSRQKHLHTADTYGWILLNYYIESKTSDSLDDDKQILAAASSAILEGNLFVENGEVRSHSLFFNRGSLNQSFTGQGLFPASFATTSWRCLPNRPGHGLPASISCTAMLAISQGPAQCMAKAAVHLMSDKVLFEHPAFPPLPPLLVSFARGKITPNQISDDPQSLVASFSQSTFGFCVHKRLQDHIMFW